MPDENLNRRQFARRVAGVAAPLITIGASNDAAAQAQPPEASKPLSPVDQMLELVQRQYPDRRLDKAALAEIRDELESQVARGHRLSAFPLTNGDEPGFAFAAYRKES